MSTPSPHKAEVPSLPGGFERVLMLSEELLKSPLVKQAPSGGLLGMYATALKMCVALRKPRQ